MNISHINDCCGCRACEHICSKKAISFSPNAEGFLVPIVDSDKCVECGVCYNKCPQAHFEEFNTNMATYAALNRKKGNYIPIIERWGNVCFCKSYFG